MDGESEPPWMGSRRVHDGRTSEALKPQYFAPHKKKGLQLQPFFIHAGRSHESTTDEHATVLHEERREHQTQDGRQLDQNVQ